MRTTKDAVCVKTVLTRRRQGGHIGVQKRKILSGLNSSSCKLFSTVDKFALLLITSVKTIYTITVDQVFQTFMFFFPRKERDSFVRKVLVLEPYSLYKVDLKRVQQAGTDVSEDCDKEDVKTACWCLHTADHF